MDPLRLVPSVISNYGLVAADGFGWCKSPEQKRTNGKSQAHPSIAQAKHGMVVIGKGDSVALSNSALKAIAFGKESSGNGSSAVLPEKEHDWGSTFDSMTWDEKENFIGYFKTLQAWNDENSRRLI